MASVDKVKVGSTSYDISPSKDGTLTGYTSNDAASPTAWSSANAITTSDTNSTIFSKVTTMVKNVRWLYSKLGTTDFSATGQSTVTGALSALQTGLNGKAASSHSHTTAQLPVSSSQTNSNSYIPTSALVYSMQQQITSLNDAITTAQSTADAAMPKSGGTFTGRVYLQPFGGTSAKIGDANNNEFRYYADPTNGHAVFAAFQNDTWVRTLFEADTNGTVYLSVLMPKSGGTFTGSVQAATGTTFNLGEVKNIRIINQAYNAVLGGTLFVDLQRK